MAMNFWRQLLHDKPWPFPLGVGVVVVLTVVGAFVESSPRHHYAGLHLTSHPPLIALGIPLVGALALFLLRSRAVVALVISVLAAIAWASLGQLSGATLVPILVALFWIAQEQPLPRVIGLALVGSAALWVTNGLLGPFGWLGGPGLTLWPEVAAAAAFGAVVSARRLAQHETQARQLEAERAREEEVHVVVNRERMRIARELHDVVAHTMAMINIQASAALILLDTEPQRASEAVMEIRAASKAGLGELRSILSVMRPSDEEDAPREIVPDLAAIRRLVADWNTAGINTTLNLKGAPQELPTAVALASFRIIQEALTNVARHATEPTTTVTLNYQPSSLKIEVANTSTRQSSTYFEGTGTGLIGMAERVRSLAGNFDAWPLPEGGFRLHVELPLPTQGFLIDERLLTEVQPDVVSTPEGEDRP
jgi:signal transduction histidine kinase